MFSNLSKGSVLYGLDTKDGIKVFNATPYMGQSYYPWGNGFGNNIVF